MSHDMHEHDHPSGFSFSNFKHRLLHDGHLTTTLKVITAASSTLGAVAVYYKEPLAGAVATTVAVIVACEQSHREQDAHARHVSDNHGDHEH